MRDRPFSSETLFVRPFSSESSFRLGGRSGLAAFHSMSEVGPVFRFAARIFKLASHISRRVVRCGHGLLGLRPSFLLNE